jgi:hypothetical protein
MASFVHEALKTGLANNAAEYMRFVTEAGNCELKLTPKLIKGRKRQVAFSIDDLPDESI